METKALIPISFSLDEWNTILNILAEHPFKQVAPFIAGIQRQVQAQMTQQPNGEDKVVGQEVH